MNQPELQAIVSELTSFVGTPVSGAWQPRRDRLYLGLGERFLLIVPRGPFARLHLEGRRLRSPRSPFSFQGACRAHLHGPLRDLRLTPGDRVVDMIFGRGRLHVRLTGRRGGIWLLDDDGAVLAAYDGPAPAQLPALPPPPPLPSRALAIRFPIPERATVNEAAARWFGQRESEARRTERRSQLRRRMGDQLRRDRRLLQALERDLDRADQVEVERRRADALASSLHLLRRGDTEVSVPDPFDPDRRFLLKVDPTKRPGDNLTALYARVRRLERTGERVLEHMERVERRARSLEAALVVLDEVDDQTLDRLETLVPHRRKQRTQRDAGPWFTWVSDGGQEVLVGRNASGNRRLTFQRARSSDFWMHLRERPGAHVLIPCQRGQSPSLDTLLAAAQIAGTHARIPEGVAFEVQYTRANQVRSIKGAPDGKVIVHEERVLRVVRDPSVLQAWSRTDLDYLDVDALGEISQRSEGEPA